MATLTGKKKTIDEMTDELLRGAKSSSSSVSSGKKNAVSNASAKSSKDSSLFDAYMKNQKKQSYPSTYSKSDETTIKSYEAIPNYNIFQRLSDKSKADSYKRKQSMLPSYKEAKTRSMEKSLKQSGLTDSELEALTAGTFGNKSMVGIDLINAYMNRDKRKSAIEKLKNSGSRSFSASDILDYAQLQSRKKETQELSDFSDKHKVIGTAITFPMNAGGGVSGLIGNTFDYLTGNPIDSENYANHNTYTSNQMRSAVSDDMGKAGQFLYNVGTSIGDSLTSQALSGFKPAYAAALQGSQAFTNSAIDSANRGLSPNQIMATSSVAAAAEAVFEKLSLDNLKGIVKGGTAKEAGKSLFKDILSQMASEGGEEMSTEVANAAADYFINGELSNFVQSVEQYKNTGMSENDAKKQAWKDLFGQIAYAGAAGAVSGGIMGGGASLINKIRGNSNISSNINENNTDSSVENSSVADTNIEPSVMDTQELIKREPGKLSNAFKRGIMPEQTAKNFQRVDISQDAYQDIASTMKKSNTDSSVETFVKNMNEKFFGEVVDTHDIAIDDTKVGNYHYRAELNKNSMEKIINDGPISLEKMSVISDIDNVLSHAEYIGSKRQSNSNSGVTGYDYFKSPINLNGEDFTVTFEVEVKSDSDSGRKNRVINKIDIENVNGESITSPEVISNSHVETSNQVDYNNNVTDNNVSLSNRGDIDVINNEQENERSRNETAGNLRDSSSGSSGNDIEVERGRTDGGTDTSIRGDFHVINENSRNTVNAENVNGSAETVHYNSKKIDGFEELNSALDRLVGMYKGNENTQSMYEQMKSAINEYVHTYNQDAIDRALTLAADIDNSLIGHSYTRKGSGKGSAKAQNNRVTTTFSEGEFVDTILAYGKELRNTARGNQTNQIQTNVVPIRNSYTDVTAKSGDKISQTRTNTIENSGMASSEELQKYHAPEQFTYESISEEESIKRAADKLNKYGQDYISDILYSENQSLSGSDIDALMMEYKRLSEIARKSGSDADWNNAQDILKKVQVASTRNAQALQALAKWSRNTPEGQLAYANTAIEQTIEKKFGQKRTQKARELVDSVYNAIKSGNTSRLGYELGKLNLGQDVISNSNEVNRNTVVDLLTKEGKIDSKLAEAIKEDTATQRKVLDMLDQMYDVGIDTYESQVLMARAGKILAGKMQHTLGDKVRQVLYNNMLGNFRTLITRNAGGNFAVAAMEQARQPLSATIDRAVSKFTGKRTTTGWSVEKQLAYVKGYAKGLNADINDIRKTLSEYKIGSNSGLHTSKSGENTLLNAIKNNDSAFKGNGIVTKMMNFTNDMVKHGLSLGDRPFFEATKSQAEVEIKQLLKKGYDIDTDGLNLDEYIDQASTLIALEAVYQGDTELSKGFQQIRNGLAEMTKGMVGTDIMSTAVVPFVKTPSNVLDMTIEYSPFGLFKNIAKTFVETKNGEFNQRRFVDETSRNLMGTLLLAGCALAYSAGHLTGGYDKDKDVKAAQKAAGMQQYALSMNGGKTNMDIGWIPVLGSAAEAGAAYGDARENGSGIVGATGKAIGQTVQSIFDQSMLESLSNFLGSNSFNDENFLTNATKNAVGSYIGMLVPSLGRQIAQSTDEYERNLGTYGTGEYYLNNLLNSIPGARQLLDVKYDNEGNKVLQNQGRSTGSKILENMLLPGKLTDVKYSDSSTEAMRLYDSTGEKTQFIPTAEKKDITTDNYTPTTEEFNNYKRLLGENNSVGAAAFMDSDFYASIDDYDKVKYLSEIYSDMKVIAKREVIPDYEIPNGSKKKMEIYDEFGIDGLVNYYYISKTSGGKDSGKINAISNLDMTDEDKGKYISMLIDISKDAETAYTWNGYEGVYSYYINNVAKNSSKVTDAEDIDALRQRIEAYANGNGIGSQNEMANRISAYVNGKKSGNTASQNTVLSIQNGTAQHGEYMQKMMNKIQAYIDSKNNQ